MPLSAGVRLGPYEVVAPTAPLFSVLTLGLVSSARQYAVSRDGARVLVNVVQQHTAAIPLTVVVNWLSGIQR